MKNKLFLSLILVASTFSNAGESSPYEVNCSVLFLQPNSSNLYYGAEATPLPIPSPNWKSLEICPDYHLGFDIGIAADFCEMSTNVALNWEHVHSSDSASKTVPITDMVGPYFNIGPDANPYKIAHGHAKHEFDAVDLKFTKQFACFEGFEASYFAGLVFTRIKQTVSSNFSNLEGTITRHVKAPSQYTGGGPEFGFDFSQNLCNNFSINGETSIALLSGVLKNHTTYLSETPELEESNVTPPNTQTTDVPNRTQLVPGFSGKLGFSYATCLSNYRITLDLGYQAQVYVNAIQSVDMSTEVTTPPDDAEVGVFALGFQRTVSNYLLNGPYVKLQIDF